MKNLILIFVVSLFSLAGFAKGPFDGITGKSLILGSDKCSATTLLGEAIISTGVNLLDEQASNVWTCKDRDYPKCPKAGVTCYSNSSSGFPAICVENPRVAEVEMVYGRGVGKKIDKRARFDSLYVLKRTASGYSHNSSWQMGDGCHPTEAYTAHRGGSGSVDLERCVENFNSLVTGGHMWSPSISKDKYCDASQANNPSYTNNTRNRIQEISRCFELYPHLLDKYAEFRDPSLREAGANQSTKEAKED